MTGAVIQNVAVFILYTFQEKTVPRRYWQLNCFSLTNIDSYEYEYDSTWCDLYNSMFLCGFPALKHCLGPNSERLKRFPALGFAWTSEWKDVKRACWQCDLKVSQNLFCWKSDVLKPSAPGLKLAWCLFPKRAACENWSTQSPAGL